MGQWQRASSRAKSFAQSPELEKCGAKAFRKTLSGTSTRACCEKAGLEHIASHDLRRTCAKLCHSNGGEIEQIQFLLGHASVQTTERYFGCKQNLGHPVNDLFRLGNVDVAASRVLAGTAALTARTEGTQPDRMAVDEGSGHQEGSDERASIRFQGDGHLSV